MATSSTNAALRLMALLNQDPSASGVPLSSIIQPTRKLPISYLLARDNPNVSRISQTRIVPSNTTTFWTLSKPQLDIFAKESLMPLDFLFTQRLEFLNKVTKAYYDKYMSVFWPTLFASVFLMVGFIGFPVVVGFGFKSVAVGFGLGFGCFFVLIAISGIHYYAKKNSTEKYLATLAVTLEEFNKADAALGVSWDMNVETYTVITTTTSSTGARSTSKDTTKFPILDMTIITKDVMLALRGPMNASTPNGGDFVVDMERPKEAYYPQ
ncbi:hypothetical protein HDV05_000855 [Chytridiales sp. JEL 0842]|nr:hypothetical protein HDV05_000855 [Chytridiales sp. JEL 0842]